MSVLIPYNVIEYFEVDVFKIETFIKEAMNFISKIKNNYPQVSNIYIEIYSF